MPIRTWPQTVDIIDPELRIAVRKALNKLAGEITYDDMARLIHLQAVGRGIERLEGIEAARNLEELNLGMASLAGPNNPIKNGMPL